MNRAMIHYADRKRAKRAGRPVVWTSVI